jgi:hypothetical protein
MSEMNHTAEFSEEEVLEQAIQRLHAGESLESILAGSGPHGAWLAPLLATAAQVGGLISRPCAASLVAATGR